jgi:hypothetical protein
LGQAGLAPRPAERRQLGVEPPLASPALDAELPLAPPAVEAELPLAPPEVEAELRVAVGRVLDGGWELGGTDDGGAELAGCDVWDCELGGADVGGLEVAGADDAGAVVSPPLLLLGPRFSVMVTVLFLATRTPASGLWSTIFPFVLASPRTVFSLTFSCWAASSARACASVMVTTFGTATVCSRDASTR